MFVRLFHAIAFSFEIRIWEPLLRRPRVDALEDRAHELKLWHSILG